ncbi:MAG: S8 family peptidase [Christensenellaceae bacterium]|jgi:subtilisin family serine protease|nr:S8 family peptidase [Christensenellaceae bacterium]
MMKRFSAFLCAVALTFVSSLALLTSLIFPTETLNFETQTNGTLSGYKLLASSSDGDATIDDLVSASEDITVEKLGDKTILSRDEFKTTVSSNFVTESVLDELGLSSFEDESGNSYLTKPFENKSILIRYSDEAFDIEEVCFDTEYETKQALEDCQNEGLTAIASRKFYISATTPVDDYTYLSNGANQTKLSAYNKELSTARFEADGTTKAEPEEVIVAVLDSGITSNHPLFAGRIVNPAATIGGYADYQDVDYVQPNGTFDKDKHTGGHGTHVAGTIVDLTLPNVKIMPVKAFLGREADDDAIIAGIEYVLDRKKAGDNIVAINMSFGCDPIQISDSYWSEYQTTKRLYQPLIDALNDAGISVCVAAGNGDSDGVGINGALSQSFPAACDGAIAISAYNATLADNDETKPMWSNYGPHIAISAPGVNIKSANYKWDAHPGYDERTGQLRPNEYNDYMTQTGTSMAAPHVAAALALIASDPAEERERAEIESTLFSSTFASSALEKVGDMLKKKNYFGWGKLNLSAIVADANYEGDIAAPTPNPNNPLPETVEIRTNWADVYGGYITRTRNVSLGASVEVVITAKSGFYIKSVLVDGAAREVERGSEKMVLTFTEVDANHEIIASFEKPDNSMTALIVVISAILGGILVIFIKRGAQA